MTKDDFKIFCVVHPDREAWTTSVQIPICKECADAYATEGRATVGEQSLVNRHVFRGIIDVGRQANHPSATGFQFYGY
jgi:hypothetical protein